MEDLSKQIRIFVQTTSCAKLSNSEYLEKRIAEMIEEALKPDQKTMEEELRVIFDEKGLAVNSEAIRNLAQDLKVVLERVAQRTSCSVRIKDAQKAAHKTN